MGEIGWCLSANLHPLDHNEKQRRTAGSGTVKSCTPAPVWKKVPTWVAADVGQGGREESPPLQGASGTSFPVG